ncbi:MAG: menaquinone-dependent protoporphyrinogen IX dehydrogenase [Brachymonas sp.]|nr:menaquinone-dependent protoporphyrinogen IX dehydrogenase [Brachymonas sp.]
MKPTLIVYSTTDGQTLRICERLQTLLAQHQLPVQLMPVAAAQTLDVSAFGVVVLGASIRYGRHQQEVYRFVVRHKATLHERPSLFFSVSAVARKPEKQSAQGNPYVRKFLRQTGWQPQHVTAFGGRIDYPLYAWLDKQIIRLIMRLTNGPSDGRSCNEFTDWQQVEALGQKVAELQWQWGHARCGKDGSRSDESRRPAAVRC